jgi:hypothetical protein
MERVSYWNWTAPPKVTVTVACKCGHEVTEEVSEGREDALRSLRALEICKDCQAAGAEAAKALRAECEASGTLVYLRYGKPPASGCSRNGAAGGTEAGVSAYPAYRLTGGRYVMDLGDCGFSAMWLSGRPVYVITGTLLDAKGSDGEPLLAGVKARKLPATAAVKWLT